MIAPQFSLARFRLAAIDDEVGLERHRLPRSNLVQIADIGVLISAAISLKVLVKALPK
ncbi:hypothetical protein [Mycobacterium sp.]|uniref:hypothetical protein n=1 Tax=Mycobacterium sp. TaxID=1785 RepID=UPI003BAE1E7B